MKSYSQALKVHKRRRAIFKNKTINLANSLNRVCDIKKKF